MLSVFEMNNYHKDEEYGQFRVLNRNLLYCFLKSMYGRHLNSRGTDSLIFVAGNLNVDVP